MKTTSENASGVFNSSCHSGCDVLNLDGVYHARLSLGTDEPPILIALHGIRTESEALQALRSFNALRPLPCCPDLTPA